MAFMNKAYTVITGAHGFIGSNLLKNLSIYNNNIFCLDRNIHSLFDISSLENLLKDCEIIYHFAGSTAGSGHNPGTTILAKNNIEATHNLLLAIKRYCKKRPLLINMSSIHVYDKSISRISETSNILPSNTYGITKITQEYLIQQATEIGIIKSIIFRASNIYGENEKPNHNSAISTFCNQIKKNETLNLFANGEACLDLIYIDDVIDILVNIDLIKKHNGVIYNLASGKTTSINDVITILKKISGLDVKVKLIEGEKNEISVNINKLKAAYPKLAQHTVYAGLKKTYENSI